MSAIGPILTRFLKLAAVICLAASAFSQAPLKYDPATGAKPMAYLVMKSGPDSVQVFLCPKKFLDDMGIVFKADDEIEVTGSKVKQDGADLMLAREVIKSGDTVTLRFKDGKPAW